MATEPPATGPPTAEDFDKALTRKDLTQPLTETSYTAKHSNLWQTLLKENSEKGKDTKNNDIQVFPGNFGFIMPQKFVNLWIRDMAAHKDPSDRSIVLVDCRTRKEYEGGHLRSANSLAMDHAPFDPKGDKLYEEGGWDRHVKLDAPKEEAVDGIKGPPDKNNCKTLQKLLALKGRPVLVVFYCQSATIRSPCAAAWYANKYVLPNKYPNKQAAELLDKQYIAVLHGGISSIDGALRLIKGKDSKDEAKEKDQDKYYHKENKELPCPCTTEQME